MYSRNTYTFWWRSEQLSLNLYLYQGGGSQYLYLLVKVRTKNPNSHRGTGSWVAIPIPSGEGQNEAEREARRRIKNLRSVKDRRNTYTFWWRSEPNLESRCGRSFLAVAIPIPSGEGQNAYSAENWMGKNCPVAIPIPSGEGQNGRIQYSYHVLDWSGFGRNTYTFWWRSELP